MGSHSQARRFLVWSTGRGSDNTYNVKFHCNTWPFRPWDVGTAGVNTISDVRRWDRLQLKAWKACVTEDKVVIIDGAVKG